MESSLILGAGWLLTRNDSETGIADSTPESNYTAPRMQFVNGTDCPVSAEFQYIMFPVMYSLVFVLGLAGNVIALWHFISTKTATSPANVFMVNLAVIDLIFVLTLPFKIIYHALSNNWIFGELMCKITGSLFFANMYGSTLFLTGICLDRYVAVVHPIKSLQLRKPWYRVVISCMIWMILGVAIMYLTFKGPLTSKFENNNTACLENFSSKSWKGRISGVSIMAAVIGFFIPFVIIIICYPLIARKLMVPIPGSTSSTLVKRKALRTILVVLATFIVCFVPYHVNQLIHTLRRINIFSSCALIQFTYSTRRVTMALTSLNSCLDPLVYYFAAENFKWKPSCCKNVPPKNKMSSIRSFLTRAT
nr:PREDICTED: lysophosphatidic acid receptor 6-like [Latimeria chalumnae]|eukprot:XP_006010168.2 PREDICTED: lysophosphatidic acid receptor 6-like [Latimeria chalumnae]